MPRPACVVADAPMTMLCCSRTAVHWAAHEGKYELVRLLLAHDAAAEGVKANNKCGAQCATADVSMVVEKDAIAVTVQLDCTIVCERQGRVRPCRESAYGHQLRSGFP